MTAGGPLQADIVVIGAGSAGSVIAARLSEAPNCRVVVLEAGGAPEDPDIADPLKWPVLPGRAFDYGYRTVPQRHTAGRVHDWPRGKVLGGSSCLHAMAWVRGHPDDFLPWAAAGGPAWSYEGLLPGFRRSEAAPGGDPAVRGFDGPIPILLPDHEVHPVVRAYMESGLALGAPWIGDHNGGPLRGVAPNSLTIRDGRRVSVADAYLTDEVLARPNLQIVTGVAAERLLFAGDRVAGVRFRRNGATEAVEAGEVVLAAGAIDSPLLLMRSGIGDPQTLAAVGIEPRHPLRGVGRNLQDHLLVLGNIYRARRDVPPSRLQHSESLMYLDAADPTVSTGAPEIVLACVAAPSAAPGLAPPPYGCGYSLLCGVCHPESRGTVAPGGPAVEDPPVIDPNYLASARDRTLMRAALRMARCVGHAAPLGEWRDEEIAPGPDADDDDALDAFIARAACTHHHPAGTCRMGSDEDAVVDGSLRLHGLKGVAVVDASVMPTLPSGPINAATVAIAEVWSHGRTVNAAEVPSESRYTREVRSA